MMKLQQTQSYSFSDDIRASGPLPWVHHPFEQGYRVAILLLSDILALAGAWKIARYLNQFYSPLPPQLVWWKWFGIPSLFWVFVAGTLLLFACENLYGSAKNSQNYLKTVKLVSFIYLFSLVISYFYDPKVDPPRSLFFTAWVSSVVFVLVGRLLTTLILGQMQARQPKKTVFIIASAAQLPKLLQILQRRSQYQVVGAALATTANSTTTLNSILDSKAVEVLAEDLPHTNLASALYWNLRRTGITLRLLPSSREILYRRGVSEIMAGLPTLRVETPLLVGWDYRLKRLVDFIGSFIGITLLSPLFIMIALIIKLSSKGPIFFRQERTGLQGKTFYMWKFRTMVNNASQLQSQLEAHNESQDGIMFKMKNDPRIIPFGHFMRRTSIDELPQLFNVLMGHMSLVGPRPLPLRDVEKFQAWHHIRHQVVPGITGLWQISGRSDLQDFNDAARLDLFYIDNWSLNLDLDILVETVRIVLFGKGAY
ncbi:sugar transferase [Chroococcus sp. FPU101]|uniref:sugar transferase n=1 Tax=Chroococcus sp. FPU101 TaxID=1974212 RepID=UPI001AA700B7|nr:sugar transferase [Chroococcus sp. FPU101]GFE71181.1 exopolysaccharide biosynthesis polyprenyl glycosylphosphotransferase [Chroococcus sp. FPU101]